MKKIFLIISFVLIFLFLVIEPVSALCVEYPWGLVPCGRYTDAKGNLTCPCEIGHFFLMLVNIYQWVVWWLATPLAVLMLTIGGIMILISAGNPNLVGLGKKILWVSIIGLVLVFCSWLIIDFIMSTLGYALPKPWWQL
jgi:hypothetical protein